MATTYPMIAHARADAHDALRALCPPGATVYTILRHVSRSGMRRHISLKVLTGDPTWPVRDITVLAARVTGGRLTRTDDVALVIDGHGMDMGFDAVYTLSRVLYPDGFPCIGNRCPSNDHSNRETRAHHPDGGYALQQEWL